MNLTEHKPWEPLEWIAPTLMKVDFTQTSVKLIFSLFSTLLCLVVFLTSALWFSRIEHYRYQGTKQKIFWNLAIVRAIYGIFFTFAGAWGVFMAQELDKDVVFGTSQTVHFVVTMTVGFFVFECLALGISDYVYNSFNILLNLHHWICLVYSSLVLTTNTSHALFIKGLLLESSTPFSAACWILLKCGKERSLVWQVNQYVLVHVFHCRNIIELYIVYIIYQNWAYLWKAMPPAILLIICILTPTITCVMTPYWTYKKTVQMVTPHDFNFENVIPRPETVNRKEKNG